MPSRQPPMDLIVKSIPIVEVVYTGSEIIWGSAKFHFVRNQPIQQLTINIPAKGPYLFHFI